MVKPALARCTTDHLKRGGLPMLSLSEAAKVSGQSKSTIWRAVNSGRISATRTYTGDYQIDPAELHRVFPPGTGDGRTTTVSMKRDATDLERAEAALMQSQIEILLQVGELIRHELDDAARNRDALRSQADLSHGATAAPAKPAGWLRRLVG
jgi:hypothetical protein